jgi:hypothetical protein
MQMAWLPRRIGVAMLLCIAGVSAPRAEPEAGNRLHASDHPWTVATMAPDGSWGVATEVFIYQAIAEAVSNCKKMSRQSIGCGAQLRAIRAGWIVAMRCGRTNIIAAEESIAAAESAAAVRERELRLAYAEEIPPCLRVMTVNPYGSVIRRVSETDRSGRAVSESNAR